MSYTTSTTAFGTWRRHTADDGKAFAEFVSHTELFGWPLLHITRGKCPETGGYRVARGIFAVGRIAVGVIAFGQVAIGGIACGQLALGLLFGFGQAATGILAFGQLALGMLLGVGQLATGFAAIGQFAYGHYLLAQWGWGNYVWSQQYTDPQAKMFFLYWWNWLADGWQTLRLRWW